MAGSYKRLKALAFLNLSIIFLFILIFPSYSRAEEKTRAILVIGDKNSDNVREIKRKLLECRNWGEFDNNIGLLEEFLAYYHSNKTHCKYLKKLGVIKKTTSLALVEIDSNRIPTRIIWRANRTYLTNPDSMVSDLILYLKKNHIIFSSSDHDIIRAIKSGDMGKVRQIVSANPRLVNGRDKYGWTPLHWAALKNRLRIASYLISRGANVKAKNKGRDTPLHCAAKEGHIPLIELLINKGADVNAKNIFGWTPLKAALKKNKETAAEVLKNYGAKEW